MATYTNNLNLEKPDKTEQYSIDVFNANAEKIDNFAGLTPPRAITADKLTTGVNINDVFFDGTQDIKIETGGGLEIGDIGFTQMSIDETKGLRRKLNGQIIIQEQYAQLTNIVKSSIAQNPDMACTESEWQTEVIMSVFGICYKFVIDDEAGTIRLPKYPNYFIGGLNDIVKAYGNGKAIGLTNGQTNAGLIIRALDGSGGRCLSLNQQSYGANISSSSISNSVIDGIIGLTSDSINSGIEAQIETEQIKGNYFIQVATGAETEDNIINEIELNNPYSFGDSKYSPVALNNLSWLKSEGQWNSKAVYPAYYDWALTNFNNGVKGFALSTGEYTDYDVVINSVEETFRLPLLDGSEDLPSNKYINLALGASDSKYTAPANGFISIKGNATNGNFTMWASSGLEFREENVVTLRGFIPVLKDEVIGYAYSNFTATNFVFIYAQGNGSLYYYVGETVQNANLINAGRIEEKLANLIPQNKELITSYSIPDYTKGITANITTSTSALTTLLTAPSNGYVLGYISSRGGVGRLVLGVYEGSTKITEFANCQPSYDAGTSCSSTVYFHIQKGQIIKLEATIISGSGNIKFYPTKGAN